MAGKQRRRTKAADPKKALRAARAAANKDKHEVPFLRLWTGMYPHLPVPERDYKFHPERKWKADLCWVHEKIIVELHGGGGRGRHARITGMTADCDKSNAAQLMGFRYLTFTVLHLKDMKAVIDLVALVVESA